MATIWDENLSFIEGWPYLRGCMELRQSGLSIEGYPHVGVACMRGVLTLGCPV